MAELMQVKLGGKEKFVQSFEVGTLVRVNDEAYDVPPEFWGKEGVVLKRVTDPGIAHRPKEWEPAYHVRFESLNRMYIVEDKHLSLGAKKT